MTNDSSKPPESSVGDEVHLAIRAALELVPLGGGAAAELFARVVTPPLEKRLRDWRGAVGQRLAELEKQGRLTVEELVDDPAFISATMNASQAALKTHHEEKLTALRNAVVNVALHEEPDESMQATLIQLVDRLTPWHLHILDLFHGPEDWFRRRDREVPSFYTTSAYATVLERAFPELEKRRDLYDRLVNELHREGLLSADANGFHTNLTASGGLRKITTDFGDRFLAFIADTDDDA